MNEFTISSLLAILRKCIWYVIIVAVVFAVAAYSFCSFVATPTYQSSISFIATNGGIASVDDDPTTADKMNNTDIAASLALLGTYVDIFKTVDLYEEVKEDTGLDYSAIEIMKMVSVQPRSDESLFIDITVTTTNPKHSVKIADSIYKLGGDYVVEQLPKAYIKAMEDSDKRAVQNYPNTPITIVIAAFLGAVLVFVIAVIANMMDKTIKGEKDFSENYDIPILGNIPNFKTAAREERK